MKLQKRHETLIGERGNTLSGEQRIAPDCVIRNGPMLILDEPMVARHRKRSEGLGVPGPPHGWEGLFLIACDLRSVANADLVLASEGGRIVEHGSHSDLMVGSSRCRQPRDLELGRHETGEST